MDIIPSGPDISVGGDALILEDLPANFTVGCDTMSFSTKHPFPGFKDIPPGAHLIWVSPTDSSTSRTGHWFYVPQTSERLPGKTHLKRWDKESELLVDVDIGQGRGEARLQQIFTNLPTYQCDGVPRPNVADQGVAPLPDFLSNGAIWEQLTYAIRPQLLDRAIGQTRTTWPVTTSDRVAGETRLAEETWLYEGAGSDKGAKGNGNGAPQLKFTYSMDAQLISPSASGAERTRQALDPTSWLLQHANDPAEGMGRGENEILVGEIQLSFLTGMHLGNFSCLEQWWFLMNRLAFRAYDLVHERPSLAKALILTLHAQLAYSDRFLDGDVLDMMPEEARKLRRALVVYRQRVGEELASPGISEEQKQVGDALAGLESWLAETLDWELRGDYVRAGPLMLEDGEMVEAEMTDFEDEDERGEFAAQVVELDGEGRQADLVSWDR